MYTDLQFKEIVTLRGEHAHGETLARKTTLTGWKAKVTRFHQQQDPLQITPQTQSMERTCLLRLHHQDDQMRQHVS